MRLGTGNRRRATEVAGVVKAGRGAGVDAVNAGFLRLD
jgi:hypothetical protein